MVLHPHTTSLIISCLTTGPKRIEQLRTYIRYWHNVNCQSCMRISSRTSDNEQYLPEQLDELLSIEAIVHNMMKHTSFLRID